MSSLLNPGIRRRSYNRSCESTIARICSNKNPMTGATSPRGRGVIERYRDFLPVTESTPIVSLGEGRGSTAANAMSRVAIKAKRQGIRLFITGTSPTVRRALLTHGVSPPRARYRRTIARAIADIRGIASSLPWRRLVSLQAKPRGERDPGGDHAATALTANAGCPI